MSEWKRLYHVNTSVNDFRQKILSNYNRYNFILFYFASRVSFLNLNRTIKSYLLFYALFLIAERLKVRLLCIFFKQTKKASFDIIINVAAHRRVSEWVSERERRNFVSGMNIIIDSMLAGEYFSLHITFFFT